MTDRYFEDLPVEARKYVERVEQLVGCPVGWVRLLCFKEKLSLFIAPFLHTGWCGPRPRGDGHPEAQVGQSLNSARLSEVM